MKTVITLFFLPLFLYNWTFAQHSELHEKPTMYKGCNTEVEDSSSLLAAFKKGEFAGHFRYFFMYTNNEGNLTDYFANGAGGGLKYESAIYHHFQFGVSGFYVFNVFSSDLGAKDSLTGQSSRYEIGLFDMENPYNHKDIDRLEEFYLNYRWKKGWITFGRQLINTPFINLQDGRMRPTGVEGITAHHQIGSKHKFEAGLLWDISPRSTTRWYSVGESIGLYPQGVTTTGQKATYFEHVESGFVTYFDYQLKFSDRLKLQLHQLTVDRLLASEFVQIDWSFAKNDHRSWSISGQGTRQDALVKLEDQSAASRYIDQDSHSMVFCGRLERKSKSTAISANYTRILADGRYLMPREWGRDPFFTFMPRERNEGYADLHAVVLKADHTLPSKKWRFQAAAGYFSLPDVKNYFANKYGMASYLQGNIDVRYQFGKKLEGMDIQFLLVAKKNIGETYDNLRYIINKSNMGLVNLVLNYHF